MCALRTTVALWCTGRYRRRSLSLSFFFCFSLSTVLYSYSYDTLIMPGHIAVFFPTPTPLAYNTLRFSSTVSGTVRYSYIHREKGKMLPCRCRKQNLSWFGLASNESLGQETILRPERETTRERASH
ncbi:hypothetical protein HOY82DRAFT_410851 [Tuber indicum]|nr:hypothetical protein HOY82DRAFT_410851 [Tuber indicum]